MRFPTLRVCVSVIVFLIGSKALRAEAPVHTVDLSPPWTVGQLFEMEAASNQNIRSVVTSGSKIVTDHKQSSVRTMKADAVALALHPNGGLRKALYIVRSFRVGINGAEETPFLPKGTKIVVEQTDTGKSITVDGKPATPEQTAAITVLTPSESPKYTSQAVFGPGKPVAVGESWPINASAFRETLTAIRPGSAEGSVKLVAHESDGTVEVAVLSGTITVGMEDAALPSGFTLKTAEVVLGLEGRVPAKRSGAEHRESMKTSMRIHGESAGADGQTVAAKIVGDGEDRLVLRYR